jgi:predicted hotdog family 3-hydroxylacyl-ACP dehydratase
MFNIEIEKLIPHRDGMKLVDEIIEVEDKSAITASTVTERWPLLHNNAVNPIIMVELVAQSIGIGVGYHRLQDTGKGVYGWIVGIKQANFSVSGIPVGTRLINRVASKHEHEGYAVFKGTVEDASTKKIFCEIELQVYSPE